MHTEEEVKVLAKIDRTLRETIDNVSDIPDWVKQYGIVASGDGLPAELAG